MRTLIIYDDNGMIYYRATGNVLQPVGLQSMFVDIPEGKLLERVDTTKEHTPVFVDIPKSEVELKLEQLQKAVEDIILGGTL